MSTPRLRAPVPSIDASEDRARRAPAQSAFAWVREHWIFGVLVVIVLAFSIDSSHFLSQANWLNTSSAATEVMLLAVGQTFVIVSGGIDLSVGASLGLSGMCGAWVMEHFFSHAGVPTGAPVAVTAIGFAVTLLVGAAVGLVNGVLIAQYDIPPFVVTLGTLGICTGLADLISNGQEITVLPLAIGNLGNDNLGGWVPVIVIATALITVAAGLVLARTRFGALTYTIGDNREAAVRAGVADRRHLRRIYVLSGALAGVAAMTVMARLAAASPTSGSDDELNAIAAVVIGGASLFGGRGTIAGAVIGTLIISVLLTGLIIINVPSFWQLVAVGAVLIAAVYVDQLGTGRRLAVRRGS
ncbi:MAG TPA: ABC transporter permease [Solirubrobacteraceae bacterium]|nr:ABC transporter permease [Solirubrobacteraceae bacterium]